MIFLKQYKKVLIPEINLGQLSKIIRGDFMIEPIQYNVVRGLPFKAIDIENKIEERNGKLDEAIAIFKSYKVKLI